MVRWNEKLMVYPSFPWKLLRTALLVPIIFESNPWIFYPISIWVSKQQIAAITLACLCWNSVSFHSGCNSLARYSFRVRHIFTFISDSPFNSDFFYTESLGESENCFMMTAEDLDTRIRIQRANCQDELYSICEIKKQHRTSPSF